MGRPVGDRHHIHFAVDVIAVFQHRAKRRRAARRLKYYHSLFAPLVARVLAVGYALNGPQLDVETFLFEKTLVMSHPHRRYIQRQGRSKDRDFLFGIHR